jgi:branched-chain amino acid transport system permease protein
MIVTISIVIAGLAWAAFMPRSLWGSAQYGVASSKHIHEFIMLGHTPGCCYDNGINPNLLSFAPSLFLIGFYHRPLQPSDSSVSMDIFESKSMLATFGLLFIIQNIAILIWTADIKGYSYLNYGVSLWGAIFPVNRLVTLLFAVVIGAAFYLFLAFTRLGKAIRAAAQDPRTAGLMGVNINQVLALCFGLGAMMASFAGALLSMCYPIKATMGMEYAIIAIIVVVLGGLGSIVGSFIGGFILGIIGSIVIYFEPSLTMVAYYFIFTLLLLARPTGILGK